MLRQMLILSGLGIAMWAIAMLFFMLFGDWVLVSVGEPQFGASLFLLEALTVLVLIGAALVVRLKLFPAAGSATRFGYVGTLLGLALDTFVVWYRERVFPDFDEGQHHAFTIWMTLAYVFVLLVPLIVDRLVRTKREPAPPEHEAEEAESVDPLV
ncbi:DUF5367 family protein [Cohnella sp. REN36]|uniref:DUF5367 family protein n=1 Tax=Cohnella sp. REN36 TaxID=2887347 RepID=UPI001D14D7A0|nr:DUF5367 family protein [Cohnella sp. REN36]MCC3375580.1 DUF5367 family protein [Cohnella sp. REN36]